MTGRTKHVPLKIEIPLKTNKFWHKQNKRNLNLCLMENNHTEGVKKNMNINILLVIIHYPKNHNIQHSTKQYLPFLH